jgi:hypothetical protein
MSKDRKSGWLIASYLIYYLITILAVYIFIRLLTIRNLISATAETGIYAFLFLLALIFSFFQGLFLHLFWNNGYMYGKQKQEQETHETS